MPNTGQEQNLQKTKHPEYTLNYNKEIRKTQEKMILMIHYYQPKDT